jgi:hypothetical protein
MQRRTRDGYSGVVTSLLVDCKPHDVIRTSTGLGSEIYVEILHIKYSLGFNEDCRFLEIRRTLKVTSRDL